MQDYKCLCAAVTICCSLVNTQTDVHKHTSTQTTFWPGYMKSSVSWAKKYSQMTCSSLGVSPHCHQRRSVGRVCWVLRLLQVSRPSRLPSSVPREHPSCDGSDLTTGICAHCHPTTGLTSPTDHPITQCSAVLIKRNAPLSNTTETTTLAGKHATASSWTMHGASLEICRHSNRVLTALNLQKAVHKSCRKTSDKRKVKYLQWQIGTDTK